MIMENTHALNNVYRLDVYPLRGVSVKCKGLRVDKLDRELPV